MKLGILKTDEVRPEWVDEYGEYPDMFIELLGTRDPSLRFEVYDAMEQEYPEYIDDVDAYLITGSKFGVYDDLEWIHRLTDYVRDLHQAGKKIVGICFGHQLMTLALGGRAEKAAAGWGVGIHTHQFNQRPEWMDEGSSSFNVLVSHQDQVLEPPPGATTLAGSDFCPHAVCQIGQQVLTFQGHPEFRPEYSREIMEFRRERIGESIYQSGIASLAVPPETDRMANWILRFLKS
ncbi:MAG: GMP synthase [Pseudomonadota bacterium]